MAKLKDITSLYLREQDRAILDELIQMTGKGQGQIIRTALALFAESCREILRETPQSVTDDMEEVQERKQISEQKQQVPSIGRVVHLVHGTTHLPAWIVRPPEPADDPTGLCGLWVITMDGGFSAYAAYDPDGAPATWHWPEFVPPT